MLLGTQSYQPCDEEPFMNETQLEHFRNKLLCWRNQLEREFDNKIDDVKPEGDIVDVASNELQCTMDIQIWNRQRKLISKIDEALCRINEGTYGYCEETGDPINLRRLEAQPIATLSIEAQERHERMKKNACES
jgi:DnaK suppressor protein